MTEPNKHGVRVRIKPGSALERLLRRTPGENRSDKLHRLAERLEAFEQGRSHALRALVDDGK